MAKQLIHVVIGGGAAGIFAAIRCKSLDPSAQVILLEKTNQLLAKVRISGGGRCNVTHACFDPLQLSQNYPRGSKELVGPFHHFQPKDTFSWFEERGVALKTESDGRCFPTTDSSETIIKCLLDAASVAGVEIRKLQRVESIQKKEDRFLIQLENHEISADCVLLASGSSSQGYSFAKELGHAIIEPVPSLFTFNIPSSPLLDLSGISVPEVIVTLKDTNFKQKGPLLFTHWGFSGPAILKLSAWAARKLHELDYKATLLINWTAAPNEDAIYQSLLRRKEEYTESDSKIGKCQGDAPILSQAKPAPKQTNLEGWSIQADLKSGGCSTPAKPIFKSRAVYPLQTIPPILPNNLLKRLCMSLQIDPTTPLVQLPNKALAKLASKLYSDAYFIEGKTTYKQEFVTAGGVDLKGVDFRTMESKIAPGLFFAGEILNIDGITGGFNFQNAWTTGWLAGTAMGKRCEKS